MADDPAPLTPDVQDQSLSEPHSAPHHFGLMSIEEATEAAARMNRHPARMSQARRR